MARKLVVILFLLQLGLFTAIVVHPYTITPKDHTYTQFSKNYYFPIFFYPNMILQAKEGSWSITDTHSTLPQKPVQTQWFFIIAGKFSNLIHVDQTVMYILSQITGVAVLFAATYIFITRLLPKRFHVLAMLLALSLELGPLLPSIQQLKAISSWTPAIGDFALIFRHFDLPHHIWGEALGFISLILVILAYQKPTALRIIGIFVTTLLSIAFLPTAVITLWLAVYPVFFLWALCTRTLKKILIPMGTAFIATGIAGLQTKIALIDAGIPWSAYLQGEKMWMTNADALRNYGSSLLLYCPFLLTLIILMPFVWKHWNNQIKLIVFLLFSWIITPFLYISMSTYSFFPIANFRIIIGPMYICAGILSAVAVIEGVRFISSGKIRKIATALIVGLTMGFSVWVTTVYLTSFFQYQERMDSHAYVATSTWLGMQFLRSVPKGNGVMVREPFGEMLPGFADIRVYIGGTHNYPDWLQRRANAITFFSGTMTEAEAKQFLISNDITYVFYGPDEQAVTTNGPLYPDILKPIFQNKTVTIFSL